MNNLRKLRCLIPHFEKPNWDLFRSIDFLYPDPRLAGTEQEDFSAFIKIPWVFSSLDHGDVVETSSETILSRIWDRLSKFQKYNAEVPDLVLPQIQLMAQCSFEAGLTTSKAYILSYKMINT
jgi:hypothetical protein